MGRVAASGLSRGNVDTDRPASRLAMGACALDKGWIGAGCAWRKVERVEGIEPNSKDRVSLCFIDFLLFYRSRCM